MIFVDLASQTQQSQGHVIALQELSSRVEGQGQQDANLATLRKIEMVICRVRTHILALFRCCG